MSWILLKTVTYKSSLLVYENGTNVTEIISGEPVSDLPVWAGFLFLFGASFFWGSNFVPAKQFETGDGLFYQLVLCMGIWSAGCVLNFSINFPPFRPLPVLGGVFWTTGNLCVVPIIKTIGLGQGIILWNTISLFMGWATSKFGWFGLQKDVISNEVLNYVGVVLAVSSTVFFVFIKTNVSTSTKDKNKVAQAEEELEVDSNELRERKEQHVQVTLADDENKTEPVEEKNDIFNKMSTTQKRLLGMSLAFFSGIMYGEANTPTLYQSQQDKSVEYMDYLFSYYTGILLTSMFYFIVYCIVKKNHPVILPSVFLPGLVSGWMWAAAHICYFQGTSVLSQAISFPIINCIPQIISTLWGVLVFKEIRGKKNFIFLSIGFVVAITAAVIIGLSF